MKHNRTDILPVLIILLRKLLLHQRLHVHPVFLSSQHDMGQHDSHVKLLEGLRSFSGEWSGFFHEDVEAVGVNDESPGLGVEGGRGEAGSAEDRLYLFSRFILEGTESCQRVSVGHGRIAERLCGCFSEGDHEKTLQPVFFILPCFCRSEIAGSEFLRCKVEDCLLCRIPGVSHGKAVITAVYRKVIRRFRLPEAVDLLFSVGVVHDLKLHRLFLV